MQRTALRAAADAEVMRSPPEGRNTVTNYKGSIANRSWLWLSLGILFAGMFVRRYLTTDGPERLSSLLYGCISGAFLTQALYEQHGGARLGTRVPHSWWVWLSFSVLFAVLFVLDYLKTDGPGRYFSLLYGWVAGEFIRQAWYELRGDRATTRSVEGTS